MASEESQVMEALDAADEEDTKLRNDLEHQLIAERSAALRAATMMQRTIGLAAYRSRRVAGVLPVFMRPRRRASSSSRSVKRGSSA